MKQVAKVLLFGVSGFALLACLPDIAGAQTSKPEESPTTVIVTGTRTTGVKAVDSAAPIQLVDSASLKRVGQTDLGQALAQTVPAFTIQAFGNDMANNTLSARLRGLSPNDTLVLINGKRRHGTGSISVLSGPYQGGASADFSFIPIGSIDHVEVLTDGAAAQYGTDAIAGVVNIILKKSPGGSITTSAGQYFDGGGKTGDISASYGFLPNDKSFLNLSYLSKYHGYSDRGALDPRVASYPSLTAAPGYPYLNHIQGDGASNLNVASYNAGYQLNDTWSLYSFGTYGTKKASSYENWRTPSKIPGYIKIAPYGFQPHESLKETDYAMTVGASGQLGSWDTDISTTYGKDDDEIYNYGGANSSLFVDTGSSPTLFFIGAFKFTQSTTDLDLNKSFEVGMAAPLNLAFGAEYRKETYGITAGDAASRYKEGSQAFPGFALTDAGSHARTNSAAYIDVAMTPVTAWSVDTALRFEHYSDFGDATVGKITSRYDVTPAFAIRGTVSTGFRAPTMAEEYYSATNVSPTSAFVQLPPNKPAAALLGINGLKPEKSKNYSFGIVTHPVPAMTLTVDAYKIDINDRIIATGSVYGKHNNVVVNPLINAAIAANGNTLDSGIKDTGVNLFLNGADTTTKGVEFVMTYPSDFGSMGKVDWSLSGAYNTTKVNKLLDASSVLTANLLFDRSSVSVLETQSPKMKVTGGLLWTLSPWTVSLKETYYGKSSGWAEGDDSVIPGCDGDWCKSTIKATVITDLDVSYKVSKAVKISIGANNLFNKYPSKMNSALLHSYFINGDNSAVQQYPGFSPFGINGGYYYAKLGVTF